MSLAVISVASLAFGVWSYFANLREPAITYQVDPLRTILVQSGASSDLTAQYKGIPITEGVVSVSIGIWNAGRAPIRPSDVLVPLQLKVGTGNKILSARVVRQSREIAQFRLDTTEIPSIALEARAVSSVYLHFNIIEHNDSAIVQVIYEGSPDADIAVTGVLVGQATLHKISSDQLRISRSADRVSRLVSQITGALSALTLIGVSLSLAVNVGRMRKLTWFTISAAVLWAVYLSGQLVFENFIRVPPFQFPG
jgi:hypothetical protein